MGAGTAPSGSHRCFNFMGAQTNPLRLVVVILLWKENKIIAKQ